MYKNVPARRTSEFEHYTGCRFRDPDNCSGCALSSTQTEAPNYAAWPLVYIENHRTIPARWKPALREELARTDNPAYVENLKQTMEHHGIAFDDGSDTL